MHVSFEGLGSLNDSQNFSPQSSKSNQLIGKSSPSKIERQLIPTLPVCVCNQTSTKQVSIEIQYLSSKNINLKTCIYTAH